MFLCSFKQSAPAKTPKGLYPASKFVPVDIPAISVGDKGMAHFQARSDRQCFFSGYTPQNVTRDFAECHS